MFQGVYTALITPFKGGKVDEKKFEEFVALQVEAGVTGVVPCGTTGESVYLSHEEQKRLIEICVSLCKGKILVLPGTGTVSIDETLILTQNAKKAKADGAVIITPWYIKPSQESLYQYFKKINDSIEFPFIVYNNPTRTGVETSLETIHRFIDLKNVKGVKDCSPCLQRVPELKRLVGDRLSLLTGNDDALAAFLGMGAQGGIVITPNVAPTYFVKLMKAWREADLSTFQQVWKDIYPLIAAISLETNPTTIKYAMSLVHGGTCEYRLPFVSLNPSTKQAIEKALQNLGLWEPSHRERKT
jgi:4-hydroxy-tetrahydrodipicolinate synthase